MYYKYTLYRREKQLSEGNLGEYHYDSRETKIYVLNAKSVN